MADSATTWAALINQIPAILHEAAADTNWEDAAIVEAINSEYLSLCIETGSFFVTQAQVTNTAISGLTELDLTDLSKFTDNVASGVDRVLGILLGANRRVVYRRTTSIVDLSPTRSRAHLNEYSSSNTTTHYFLNWPYLFIEDATATDDFLYVDLICCGDKATDATDSGSPAFNDELQPLGERALMYRTAAILAEGEGLAVAPGLRNKADKATDILAYNAAKLHGPIFVREYYARKQG